MRTLAVASGIVLALGLVLWSARRGGPSESAPTQTVPAAVTSWTVALGVIGLCIAGTWWAFGR